MKSYVTYGLALLALSAASVARADVTLVQDGVAKAAIYVEPSVMEPDSSLTSSAPYPQWHPEDERRRLRESVRDLSAYLEKMSGAKVPIVTGAPADDKATPIMVGEAAAKQFGALKPKSPYRQGWRVVASPKGIGLLGESPEATSYAVYELLERLGCRWYMPSEMGEVVPNSKTIKLANLDVTGAPPTIGRFSYYNDSDFLRRNRFGGFYLSAGHALEISNWITKEQLAAHPDWNAEIGGKRSINGRLCWGNPEVAAALSDGIIASLDKNYQPSISLSPDDGVNFCECEKCKALDAGDFDANVGMASITDRYVHFANQIVERVSKKYPDVLFGFYVYAQYNRPPLREKVNPRLIPVIAPIIFCRAHSMLSDNCPSRPELKQQVEGWQKMAPRMGYYNYMFHLAETSVPNPMIRQMSDELPILYKNNVQIWLPETMSNLDSVLPGVVLSMRAAVTPNLKPAEVLGDFYTKFYGAAAKEMRTYWETVDNVWIDSNEHAGCAFGYGRRFTPANLAKMRTAMDAALAACKTPMELRRVKLQDDALAQFELYMKLRRDLFEGRLANLEADGNKWYTRQLALGDQYAPQAAFTKTYWTPKTISGVYFDSFVRASYNDGTRIARDFTPITPTLVKWSYAVDKEKKGAELGWNKADFNDKAWKTTDLFNDSWFDLGLDKYYGPMWYRSTVNMPAVPAGKKVFLWVSSEDGAVKVYVNGQHVPYVNEKGEKSDEFSGWCQPVSFDVTAAVKPGAENQISIVGTRQFLNELGTGGLLGPVMLYSEK